MSIRRRWLAWQVVVVGTLLSDGVVAWRGSTIAFGIAMTSLVAMLALLATTPADAIVLPRGRSERIIVFGTLALAFFASRFGSVSIPIVATVVAIALLAVARRWRVSAWWSALVVWNPVVFVASRAVL